MDDWVVESVHVWRDTDADGNRGHGASVLFSVAFEDNIPPLIQVGDAVHLGFVTFYLESMDLSRTRRRWTIGMSARDLTTSELDAFVNGWVRERV